MFDRLNMNSFAMASLAAMGLAVLIVAAQVPAVMRAVLGPSGDTGQVSTQLASYLDDHESNMTSYVERFNGRSIFDTPRPTPVYNPPPPPPPPGPKDEVIIETQPVQPPPCPPYGGPSLLAIFGTEVWFKPQSAGTPPMRIATGQEVEGITVVEVFPKQQMAKLKWRNCDYDVFLWDNWGDAIDPLFPEIEPATEINAPGFQLETPEEEQDEQPPAEDNTATDTETVTDADDAGGDATDEPVDDGAASSEDAPAAPPGESPDK